ncbi:jerky protein homolog-like [Hydra vulgaris]|uniref:Jerky protein homolog-like n=1 Tax=Hydra vulgaris TaxID=6087 RepID=A0ABM4B1W8_HYDVU
MAGYQWAESFLKRNPVISLGMPEGTSGARAMGFNQPAVNKFLELLTKSIDENNITPNSIYNVDETGISSVPKKVSKVIAKRGKKQVGTLTSAEQGKIITIEMCMSASGIYVPPLIIFPCVRAPKNVNIIEKAPPGTIASYHPSGWMQTDIFLKWFDHFLSFVMPSKKRPLLLLLDGHATHTKNIEFIMKARENYVTVICFPPHCSHCLQPLDVSFTIWHHLAATIRTKFVFGCVHIILEL